MARKKADQEEGKITKAEAVRKAIEDGKDTPDEGVAYVKEKFGLDVTKPQFSTYKSLDKKRGGKKGPRPTRTAAAPAASPLGNGSAGLAIQVEAIKTLVDDLGVKQVVSIAQLFGK